MRISRHIQRTAFTATTSLAAAAAVFSSIPLRPAAEARSRGPAVPMHIVVGANVLVSRDRLDPLYETLVATHPTDPNQLLGGVGIMRGPSGEGIVPYVSHDGGYTWVAGTLESGDTTILGDATVAYTLLGTSIATGVSRQKTDLVKRGFRYGAALYRRPEGDTRWQYVGFVADTASFDHPQIALDATQSSYRGRVYIAKMGGPYPEYDIALFSSDDDGRTWTDPKTVIKSPPDKEVVHGLNVEGLTVFHDGTLFMGYITFDFLQESAAKKKGARALPRPTPIYCVTSTDGGQTFSAPSKVYDGEPWTAERARERLLGDIAEGGGTPKFAVDTAAGPFQDRIYHVHEARVKGKPRILFSWSTDKGKHWTSLKQVSPDGAGASQFQPAIAVAPKGTVGVLWFDTRRHPSGDAFDVYFSASTDGGETFLPATRVSSASSYPRGAGNLVPTTGTEEAVKTRTMQLRLSSMFSYRRGGGDYVGLAADLRGTFHPWWPDARSGTYRVWTARVDVVPATAVSGLRASAGDSIVKLDSLIGLVTDPGIPGQATGDITIPIRLRNFSPDTIYPPLIVSVTKLTDLIDGTIGEPTNRVKPAVLLNASNGKPDIGATMDYSNALGGWNVLPPGAVTDAIPWRIRFPGRVQGDFIDIHATATGAVRRGK